jgi:hypothetical protein
MGLGFSIDFFGPAIADGKTVKEGLVVAVAYIALKSLYNNYVPSSNIDDGAI